MSEEPEFKNIKDNILQNKKKFGDLSLMQGGNNFDLRKPLSVEKNKKYNEET